MAIQFEINGLEVDINASDDTPLLWAIRDELNLKGTKFGCGIGLCGACTVHVDGVAVRSCVLPLGSIQGKAITTIEGLNHPLQTAWVQVQAPQCGYCQSGQIMQAASILNQEPGISDEDIKRQMNGNLCRCMAYKRIHEAIKIAATTVKEMTISGATKDTQISKTEGAE